MSVCVCVYVQYVYGNSVLMPITVTITVMTLAESQIRELQATKYKTVHTDRNTYNTQTHILIMRTYICTFAHAFVISKAANCARQKLLAA